MDKNNYTNMGLARDYFRVMSQYSSGLDTYSQIRSKIENIEIDLSDLFNKDKNLDNLTVSGIGKKTKETLELILNTGFDNARLIVEDQRIKKMQSEAFMGIESKVPAISDRENYLDDVVKNYEDR